MTQQREGDAVKRDDREQHPCRGKRKAGSRTQERDNVFVCHNMTNMHPKKKKKA